MTLQDRGRQWEQDFADEFDLSLVPGSGSPWYSGKLDVYGEGARWSLKWTGKDSYRLTKKDIEEALEATGGLSGGLEIPLWAVNLADKYELIIMLKDDFKQVQSGELKVIPEVRTKTKLRTELSTIPILLREQDDYDEGFA